MRQTPPSKLNAYQIFAMAREGAKNWPIYWNEDSDPIYQEYLEALKKKEKVNVDDYKDRDIAFYETRFEKGEDINGFKQQSKRQRTNRKHNLSFTRRDGRKKSRRFKRGRRRSHRIFG